jgi:hypothetical protein
LQLTIHHTQSRPILFADVTSIVIYHHEIDCFQNLSNVVFADINKWFKANKLALKFDKTDFMKFVANNKTCINAKEVMIIVQFKY